MGAYICKGNEIYLNSNFTSFNKSHGVGGCVIPFNSDPIADEEMMLSNRAWQPITASYVAGIPLLLKRIKCTSVISSVVYGAVFQAEGPQASCHRLYMHTHAMPACGVARNTCIHVEMEMLQGITCCSLIAPFLASNKAFLVFLNKTS